MQVIELQTGERVPDPLVDSEVYAPGLERASRIPGSLTIDLAGVPVDLGVEVRHSVIHDVHNVGWWAGNLEHPRGGALYDLTVYNVGWQSTDRGHGHCLYTQNYSAAGVKRVDRCVFIAGFMLAWKIYGESPVEQPNKISSYDVRRCISVGDVIVGGRRQGAEDVVIEDCVFVGTVMLGYLGRNKRVTFRRNLVIGNLVIAPGEDLVIEDNDIVVLPPYRMRGDTAGKGNFGWKAGALDSYTNPSVRGNRVFTAEPNVAFNGWTFTYAAGTGLAAWDTVVLPLTDFPATRRSYDIPERGAKNVFVYDPAGAAVRPAGAWALYPPPNPIGWEGSAPAITPLRTEIAVWREAGIEGEDMARIAELETALKAASDRIEGLEAQAAEKDARISTLEEKLAGAEEANRRLTEQEERDAPVVEAAHALWAASKAFGEAVEPSPRPHPQPLSNANGARGMMP